MTQTTPLFALFKCIGRSRSIHYLTEAKIQTILMSNPNSRSRARSKVPGYVKLPKFLTSKDVDRLVRMKEAEPNRLWSELVAELVESKFQ